MSIDHKILGLTAFVAYFGMDALTTCIAVYMYGVNAESNPAMAAAFGASGLIGFLALKFIVSLIIIVPPYLMLSLPGSRAIGISALLAITMGGVVVTVNNIGVLLTGTSVFYYLFGDSSFAGPGILVGLTMLVAGLLIYGTLNLMEHGQYHKPRIS